MTGHNRDRTNIHISRENRDMLHIAAAYRGVTMTKMLDEIIPEATKKIIADATKGIKLNTPHSSGG